MSKTILSLLVTVSLLLLPVHIAIGGQALSWNFQLDTTDGLSNNRTGVWAYMQNNPSNTNPAKFSLLPTYQATACNLSRWNMPLDRNLNCWQDLQDGAVVAAQNKGMPYPWMNTGAVNQVIIRWTSPIVGRISVLGTINDDNATCGDGIKWYFRTTTNVLKSGIIKNGQGSSFLIQTLSVKKGNPLYLIIDKNKNNACDGTSVQMLITSQQ
jgi:hypothetical protein